MELKDLFNSKTSFFNQDLKDKKAVIDFLSQKFLENKIIIDEKSFLDAINKREQMDSTGIGDGIAIPHALTKTVQQATIGFVSLKKPIEWESLDGKPVNLVFMIATSGEDGNEHLIALADLSSYLMKIELQEKLREAKNFQDLQNIFSKEKLKSESINSLNKSEFYDVVGITACPTGIAHTYMAQEKLLEYSKQLGLTAKIETQGRRGTEDRLTIDEIKNAKVIILAHDKSLTGLDRFNGFNVIDTSTKDAIYNGKELISDFENNPKKVIIKAKKSDDDGGDFSIKKFKDVKGNLLAGVSKMLPFVVAGGIILGIGFLIDFAAGNGNAGGDYGTVNYVAGWFSALGKTAMYIMVPILGAYIAYSIVGPQGLMPGFIAGMLADGTGGFAYATNGSWANMWGRIFGNSNIPFNSGFIGAMVGGYLAALLVFGWTIALKKMPKSLAGVRDIVFIPVLSLLSIGITMFVINIPLGYAMYGIKQGLIWLANHNLLILVTALIAFMMCVDMGGPINKIAYTIGTMTVGGQLDIIVDGVNQSTIIMAAAMAGGMIPPLGIAISTVIFKKVWTAKERDAAKVNWVMGAFFITEGAIPFMITDTKRVSVSAMAGGLITGIIVGSLQITLGAPHGGVFVFPLLKSLLFNSNGAAIGLGIVFYIFSVLIGAFIMALILGFWKQIDIKKGKLIVDNGIVKKTKQSEKNNLTKKVSAL